MIAHVKRQIAHAAAIAVVATLTGCATAPPADRAEPAGPGVGQRTTPSVAARATAIALDQVGTPYRYGGRSPKTGFDCSGLVHYAYHEAGKSVPRTTQTLWAGTERIPKDSLRVGDLVFFRIEGKMQHVGLYLGDGQFVHAPSTGRRVSVASLSSPFYQKALLGGGRLR